MTGKWFPIVSSTPALCGFTNNFFGQHVSWHKTNVFHLTLSVDIARYRSVPEPGRMLVVLCLVVDLIADHRGMVLHWSISATITRSAAVPTRWVSG
jgi:hypothetical protein